MLYNEFLLLAISIVSLQTSLSNLSPVENSDLPIPPLDSLSLLQRRGVDFFSHSCILMQTSIIGVFSMNNTNKRTISLVLAFLVVVALPALEAITETGTILEEEPPDTERLALIGTSAFLPISQYRVIETVPVIVTAYSSTPEQTDSTPFITASGTRVREGIVAANFLPIGTKIRLPDLYGNRVFVVEDRMHPRKKWQVDIWFSTYQEAKNFGAKRTLIEVLEG